MTAVGGDHGGGHSLGDGGDGSVLTGLDDANGKHAAVTAHHTRSELAAESGGVDSSRHDHDIEVGTQHIAHLPHHAEGEVGL